MNDYLISVLLGIVEGLTEFLPISSTAHLRLTQALLGMDLSSGYWKMYTVVIQLGAILCLPIYFRKRIAEFLATFPKGKDGSKTLTNHPLSLTALAFVCTAAPAFLLSKLIGKHLESLYIMGGALLIGGAVMWLVDARYGAGAQQKTTDLEQMTTGQALWIGCCQTLSAIFPGTSRSMTTIAAGQLAGMSRPAALEFSFFLSIPTMVAATGYDLLQSMRHSPAEAHVSSAPQDLHGWIVLGIGFLVSFAVAYLVVAWFMGWVRRRGLMPFALYRLLAGGAVLFWASRL